MKDNICYQHLYWIHDEETYAQRVIVCAANKYTLTTGEELVVPCVRHTNPVLSQQIKLLMDTGLLSKSYCHPDDQGFIDQYSNYWTREEAMIIATYAGQVRIERGGSEKELYSEDLY